MKIVITNNIALNGGDTAIVCGMMAALKAVFGQDCEFVVGVSRPEVIRRLYPDLTCQETIGLTVLRGPSMRVIGRLWRAASILRFRAAAWLRARRVPLLPSLLLAPAARAALEHYATADLVLASGGTYLKEEYGVLSQVLDFQLALDLRRPLALYTQSLGPFTQPATLAAMRTLLPAAVCLLLRDERSLRNLDDAGIYNPHRRVSADAAFGLVNPPALHAARVRPFPQQSQLRVAYSVRTWSHFADSPVEKLQQYKDAVARSICHLVEQHGATVTFLSTCQGVDDYTDDALLAEEIHQMLPVAVAAQVTVTREHLRYDTLIQELATYDVSICTRMHMCILSLLAGVPVLPIAYEFKTTELYRRYGLERWVTPMEEIDGATLCSLLDEFLCEAPALRGRFIELTVAERDDALAAAQYLRACLEERT